MFYSIGKFAKVTGVSVSTLRNWDKSGKLKPHHKTDGGQRLYSEEQIVEVLGFASKGVVNITKDELDEMISEVGKVSTMLNKLSARLPEDM